MSSSSVTVTAHKIGEVETVWYLDAHAHRCYYSITVQGAVDADHHVMVSRIIADEHNGWETMLFFCNGETKVVESWLPVYEVHGYEEIEQSVSNYIKTVASCYNNPKESSS
tara:strand:+ start:131 stop:463 length:333 start_codon:yes stop_codon:yes gene_type:complete